MSDGTMGPGTRVLVLQMPELRVGTVCSTYPKETCVLYGEHPTPAVEPTEWCHASRESLLTAIAEARSELVGIEYKARNGDYDDWLNGTAAADGGDGSNP